MIEYYTKELESYKLALADELGMSEVGTKEDFVVAFTKLLKEGKIDNDRAKIIAGMVKRIDKTQVALDFNYDWFKHNKNKDE